MTAVTSRRWLVLAALMLFVSACTSQSTETPEAPTVTPEVAVTDGSTSSTAPTLDATTQAPDESTTTTSSAPPTTAVTTTSTTTSTTVTTLPAATAAAGTPNDPIPMGESIELGDWILAVSNVTLDATEMLQDAAEFNVPPPTGMQYVVIGLTGTFRGDTAGQPVVERNLILGDLVVPAAGDACGLIPDNLIDVQPVLAGDTFEANICFVAPLPLGGEPPLLKLEPVEQIGEASGGLHFSIT